MQVFDPDGHSVGAIAVPGAVNLAFGGAGRIFITADTAVWAATTPDPPQGGLTGHATRPHPSRSSTPPAPTP